MKAKWSYELAPASLRELKNLPRSLQVSIVGKIVELAKDPHDSPQVKKLKGSPGRFRLRVGHYRVVYTLDERARMVMIERIRHRRDAYRGL